MPTGTLEPTLTRNSAAEVAGLGDSVALDPSGIPVAKKVTALGTEGALIDTITTYEAVDPAATDWAGVGTRMSKSNAGTGAAVVVGASVDDVVNVGGAAATVGRVGVVVLVVIRAGGGVVRRFVVVVRIGRFLVVVVCLVVGFLDFVAAFAGAPPPNEAAVSATRALTHPAMNLTRDRCDGKSWDRRGMESTLPGCGPVGKDHNLCA